jgi:hypothetical protein
MAYRALLAERADWSTALALAATQPAPQSRF